MEKEEFLIHELAEKAGVTVRTIRYYTIEGLLPQPVIHGKFAYYTKDHLHRLELIRQLKDAYLPLREIRQTMSTLSEEEVQERLKDRQPGERPQMELPVAVVLEGGAKALDYIARLMDRQSILRAPGYKPKAPPVQIQESQPAYASALTGEPDPPAKKRSPVEGESWRRIELAPGLELHIRQPAEPLPSQAVQQIIAAVHSLIQTRP